MSLNLPFFKKKQQPKKKTIRPRLRKGHYDKQVDAMVQYQQQMFYNVQKRSRDQMRFVKDQRQRRELMNRQYYPHMYTGGIYGAPRDTDAIELRRLQHATIAQLCISTNKEEVVSSPWQIIENDTESRKHLLDKNPYNRDKQLLTKKVKAVENDSSLSKLAEEATYLLENPNERGMTFQQILGMAVADLKSIGNAVWVYTFEKDMWEYNSKGEPMKLKDGARPSRIMPADGLQVNMDLNDAGQIEKFYYFPYNTINNGMRYGEPTVFSPDEMCWFTYDPRPERLYGYSDVEKAQDYLDLLLLTTEQEITYFAEGSIPPGIMFPKNSESGGMWTAGDLESFKKDWRENIKGHPENIMFAPKEVGYTPFSYSYRELQYLERQQWYMKIIAGIFKLNLQVVGLAPEHTNRATAFAEKLIAYEKGVGPLMKTLERYINTQYIWRFYSEKISFVFDPVINLDEKERKARVVLDEWQAGLIKRDEARAELDYEQLGGEEGDEFKTEGGQDNMIGIPRVTEFGNQETEGSKASNDLPGVPNTTLDRLESGVQTTYVDAFNEIIEALDEVSSEWPEDGNQAKSLNKTELSKLVTENIAKMNLSDKFANVVSKAIAGEVIKTMNQTADQLKIPLEDTTEQYALNRLVERKMAYYKDIPDTLSDTVMATLESGIKNGRSWTDVRNQLMVLREDFTKNRATVIARTELGRSNREAIQIFGEKHKDKLNKKWIATLDNRTRDSHRRMDGVVIPVDQAFKVPYYLDNSKYGTIEEMTPGESKRGIQCRCKLVLERK